MTEPADKREPPDPDQTMESGKPSTGNQPPHSEQNFEMAAAFDGPKSTMQHSPRIDGSVGMVIAGKYKLLQEIGEGGMGSVWVAEQREPVKRKVAVKLIKTGMDSRSMLNRFEAERQALAIMDHPNIARVIDGGVSNGTPYFVMELVNGLPLGKFCDEAKLGIRERLELFVQICQAVQHAHQKGIVHRDLKPANILVTIIDGRATPKIIDFGVAKALAGKLTDETLATRFGAVIGTLEYMAPEQAGYSGQDIDSRADIYSLGVILYELLTGFRPFEANRLRRAAVDEMIRVIREEEPQRMSTRFSTDESSPSMAALRHTNSRSLTALLRGELDWVVLKALEKNRDRRYESATGFARDIQRYLASEPVEARPASAVYKTRKFIARNRVVVAAGSLVLMTLVAGIIGTTHGLITANTQRKFAEEKRIEAENERANAVASAKSEAEQRQKAEIAEEATLAAYKESTDDAIEQLIGSKDVLGPQEQAYLENALKRWQAFADRQGDDRRSRDIRAEGFSRVASIWSKLGSTAKARTDYDQALQLRTQLNDQFPDDLLSRSKLATAHLDLGLILAELGEHEQSKKEFVTSGSILENLLKLQSDNSQVLNHLAICHNNLGLLSVKLGDRKSAQAEYEQAIEIGEKLVAKFPLDASFRSTLGSQYNSLAILLKDLGNLADSEVNHQLALAVRKQLVSQFPEVPDHQNELGRTQINLGSLYGLMRLNEKSIQHLEAACEVYRNLTGQFPAVPLYQTKFASAQGNLANSYFHAGELEKAIAAFQEARDLRQDLVSRFPDVPEYRVDLVRLQQNRGTLFYHTGKFDEAESAWTSVRELNKDLVTQFPNVPDYQSGLAESHANLGALMGNLGRIAEAISNFESAREIHVKLVQDYPEVHHYQFDLAQSQSNFANVLKGSGKLKQALKEREAAREICRKLVEQQPTITGYQSLLGTLQSNIGISLADLGQTEDALIAFKEGIRIQSQLVDQFPDTPEYLQELARTHANLSTFLNDTGQVADAEKEGEFALAIQEKAVQQFPSLTAVRVELGGSYCNKGFMILNKGQPAVSIDWFDKAIATLQVVLDREPGHQMAVRFLRNSFLGRGLANESRQRPADALQDWARVIELDPSADNERLRASRAMALLQTGQTDEAVALTLELKKLSVWDSSDWYNFACIFSVASIAKSDNQKHYSEEAIEALVKAIESGFNDAEQMSSDTDLDPLRDRDDFKKLLDEMKVKQPG